LAKLGLILGRARFGLERREFARRLSRRQHALPQFPGRNVIGLVDQLADRPGRFRDREQPHDIGTHSAPYLAVDRSRAVRLLDHHGAIGSLVYQRAGTLGLPMILHVQVVLFSLTPPEASRKPDRLEKSDFDARSLLFGESCPHVIDDHR
jgi:hypothetical protein